MEKNNRKRPRPAALIKQIAEEVLLPVTVGGSPDLSSYQPIDIACIWDYGPIGYKGLCWQHDSFELYLAKLDGQEPWIGIIPGFNRDQIHRMVVASHKIDGYRHRGGFNGLGQSFFEYRTKTACAALVIEENHDRDALILRCCSFILSPEEGCTWEMLRTLYPER